MSLRFFFSIIPRSLSLFLFFFLMIRRPPRSTPLSLHDALPIFAPLDNGMLVLMLDRGLDTELLLSLSDRKSTRLNSSHLVISYAVFCLKKKKRRVER